MSEAPAFPLPDRTRWWTCAVCWRQHRRWEACHCLLPSPLLFEAVNTEEGVISAPMVLQAAPEKRFCEACLATDREMDAFDICTECRAKQRMKEQGSDG